MSEVLKFDDLLKDSVGNVILPNDLIRMAHFKTRTKKYYMYKQAIKYGYIKDKKLKTIYFKHFDGEGGFWVREDSQEMLKDMVVVQRSSFYNKRKIDELKRNKSISD